MTSYLHDRISAKHYGIPSTGNGRRESFRQMPIPRMRATYMEAGNVTEEEIISTVKKVSMPPTSRTGRYRSVRAILPSS